MIFFLKSTQVNTNYSLALEMKGDTNNNVLDGGSIVPYCPLVYYSL